ncbi:hypothetical protein V8C86DRAFT_3146742 [Haematococcus lacustris]
MSGHAPLDVLAQFSPAGESLALASPDGRIRVFDSATGRLKVTLGAADGQAFDQEQGNGSLSERHTCIAWAHKGKKKAGAQLLLAGTAAGDVKAYDTQLGELKWRNRGLVEGGVFCIAASSPGSSQQQSVVVGGADGQLHLLGLAKGSQLESIPVSKHPVTAAAVAPQGSAVLVAGSSMGLWDSQSQTRLAKYTGHANSTRTLVFSPDGSAAASAASGERHLALWATPAAASSSAAHDNTTIAAAAAAEGLSITGHTGVKSKSPGAVRLKGLQPAAGSILMKEPAVLLDACSCLQQTQQRAGFLLAAVSEGGQAFVWQCGAAASSPVGATPYQQLQAQLLAHVKVKGASRAAALSGAPLAHHEGIMAVKLQPSSSGSSTQLLVAYGSSALPAFRILDIPTLSSQPLGDGDHEATTIILKAAGGALLLSPNTTQQSGEQDSTMGGVGRGAADQSNQQQQPQQAGKTKHSKADVTVLGPDNAGALPFMRTAAVAPVELQLVSAGQKRKGGPQSAASESEAEAGEGMAVVPGEGVGSDGQQEGEEEGEGEGEEGDGNQLQPLGERVAAMEAAAGLGQHGAGAAGGGEQGELVVPGGSKTADSLAVLLTQALRSNDRLLLERVLATSSTRVITNTVAHLLPLDAAAFLRAAVDRLLSRPARAGQLAPWLRALLHQHTGYLMSAPGAQAPLAALYQAIDARVAVYQQLLRLHGRLGLVTAHSRARSLTGAGGEEGEGGGGLAAARPTPEVVFEDDGEEEPEAEDPFAAGGENSEGSEGSDEEGDMDEGEEEEEEEGEEGLEDDDDDM